MLKNILKKTVMYAAIALVAYLAIGYLFHLVIFPEKKPDVATYFKPGQVFKSTVENLTQRVIKHENGMVYCEASLGAHAPGPPTHIHTDFDEQFEVENGELSVWLDGKVVKIKPGEKLFIPRGTPHKPFNDTDEEIHLKGTVAFPETFAFYLTQVYGILDNDPNFGKNPHTAFQMTVLGQAGFDSYLADGPPVAIQKLTGFLLTPALRLAGYKSFYPEYDIRNLN